MGLAHLARPGSQCSLTPAFTHLHGFSLSVTVQLGSLACLVLSRQPHGFQSASLRHLTPQAAVHLHSCSLLASLASFMTFGHSLTQLLNYWGLLGDIFNLGFPTPTLEFPVVEFSFCMCEFYVISYSHHHLILLKFSNFLYYLLRNKQFYTILSSAPWPRGSECSFAFPQTCHPGYSQSRSAGVQGSSYGKSGIAPYT